MGIVVRRLDRQITENPVPTQKVDRETSILIGGRLKMARQLKGLSQSSLAEALGVTFQQVQKYETGTNRISAPMLVRAARFLDQPIEFFLATDGMETYGIQGFEARDIKLVRSLRQLPDCKKSAVESHLRALSAGS
jgi:transcriptional regulator with XRE-family HTH domain